jgi:hypothetical protein
VEDNSGVNSAHTTSTSVLSCVRRVSGQRGRLRAFGSGFALGYTSKRCTFLRRMCSRARTACFGVPSTARRTRVRLRVAVLSKSARPNAVRPAKAPRHAAPAPLMSSLRILRASLSGPVLRVRSPVACRRSAARYCVAGYGSLSRIVPRPADRRTKRPRLPPPDYAVSPPRRTKIPAPSA